jgi:hypothetical protein
VEAFDIQLAENLLTVAVKSRGDWGFKGGWREEEIIGVRGVSRGVILEAAKRCTSLFPAPPLSSPLRCLPARG